MVYASFSTQRPARRGGGWLAASAAMHVAIIAAIISSTPQLGAPTHTRQRSSEHVAFVTPSAHLDFPPIAPHVVAARRSVRRRRVVRRGTSNAPAQLALDRLDALVANMTPIAIPDSAPMADPTPNLTSVASSGIDFAGFADQFVSAVMGRAYALANPNAIYDEAAVDKIAEAMRENPKPVYPFAMRMGGVEDSFIVRFVVDTSGRVDERSLEFPNKPQKLFAASVRDALRRARYFPAVLGGQPVRQLVEQRFSFVLSR